MLSASEPAVGLEDAVAALLEDAADQLADVGLVVDDEDRGLLALRRPCVGARERTHHRELAVGDAEVGVGELVGGRCPPHRSSTTRRRPGGSRSVRPGRRRRRGARLVGEIARSRSRHVVARALRRGVAPAAAALGAEGSGGRDAAASSAARAGRRPARRGCAGGGRGRRLGSGRRDGAEPGLAQHLGRALGADVVRLAADRASRRRPRWSRIERARERDVREDALAGDELELVDDLLLGGRGHRDEDAILAHEHRQELVLRARSRAGRIARSLSRMQTWLRSIPGTPLCSESAFSAAISETVPLSMSFVASGPAVGTRIEERLFELGLGDRSLLEEDAAERLLVASCVIPRAESEG